jgi:tetratricopeptide (TPR) repeat protein
VARSQQLTKDSFAETAMSSHLRTMLAAALCLTSMTICGCFGAAQPAKRPEVHLKAEKLLEQAIRAEQKNEIALSKSLLEEAVRLSSSVEQTESTVTALINLARLQRVHLNPKDAAATIDAALLKLNPQMSMYAEAAQEKALILLTTGNLALAEQWARNSVESERGGELGRRMNLSGRILLLQARDHEAAEMVKRALQLNISSGVVEEQANSLRMLGIIARNSKNYKDSQKLLTEALQLDKDIAASGKIAADLEELAVTASAVGNKDQAAGFLQRAYSVHHAAGRLPKARKVLQQSVELYLNLGDRSSYERATATLTELDKLIKNQTPVTAPETIRPSSSP